MLLSLKLEKSQFPSLSVPDGVSVGAAVSVGVLVGVLDGAAVSAGVLVGDGDGVETVSPSIVYFMDVIVKVQLGLE